MAELYIGLMSGTSADGVDASLIQMNPCLIQTEQSEIESLAHFYLAFPDEFKQQITALYLPSDNEIERSSILANQLSHYYAQAVLALLKQESIKASDITAIGCHGQTIRHRPNIDTPFSLQITDYALLAELTQIDVIGDFRSADIAAGGQGAPLVPAFHKAIFPRSNQAQLIVNIGGIANMSLIDNLNEHVTGLDTGPGNCLLDEWCFKHKQLHYDKNGDWAASGKVIPKLLDALLSCDYFSQVGPKSSGREVFNLTWLMPYLQSNYQAEDVQATLLALTSLSISNTIKQHVTTGQVWICGGGAHNQALLNRLKSDLAEGFNLATTQAIGIDPDWVEADCFAWLAYCFTHRISANLPAVTGAKKAKILGCLYPA